MLLGRLAIAVLKALFTGAVCEPPPEAFDKPSLYIYVTRRANRWRAGFNWRAEFDLWTDRGRSDLTAIIYVKEISPGIGHGVLYDLRML